VIVTEILLQKIGIFFWAHCKKNSPENSFSWPRTSITKWFQSVTTSMTMLTPNQIGFNFVVS